VGRRSIANAEVEGVQPNPLPLLVVFKQVAANPWGPPASKRARAASLQRGCIHPPPDLPSRHPRPSAQSPKRGRTSVGEEGGAWHSIRHKNGLRKRASPSLRCLYSSDDNIPDNILIIGKALCETIK